METHDTRIAAPDKCSSHQIIRRRDPLTIHAEFVAVGGSEGDMLEEKQIAVIQEILLWLHHQTVPGVPAEQVNPTKPWM